MVITGATSGIGLVSARKAARTGARLVLAARNEEALRQLADELREAGTDAIAVAGDVGREADVRRIADAAVEHFGSFDTWVNNAAMSAYGKVEDVSVEDQRRIFDTNYWGIVYGSRIACEHLRRHGGKLINMGSALSERAIPIQGVYSASKAAIMGFTDALRMELEMDDAPVSVTLIKPGSVDTPYKEHAANYLGVEGKNPAPVYAPEVVATAILHAAEHHVRDIVVGASGKLLTVTGNVAPGLSDRVMSRLLPWMQRTRKPVADTPKGILYRPGEGLHERGNYAMAFEHSLYSMAVRHKGWLCAAAGTAALAWLWRNRA